jgi:hypothetical protein
LTANDIERILRRLDDFDRIREKAREELNAEREATARDRERLVRIETILGQVLEQATKTNGRVTAGATAIDALEKFRDVNMAERRVQFRILGALVSVVGTVIAAMEVYQLTRKP